MKPNVLIALVLLGVGGFIWYQQNYPPGPGPLPNPNPTPTPDLVYPMPSAEMQGFVVGLKAFRGKKNADLAAKFYWDFADVLERDQSSVAKTNAQFRAVHIKAQTLWAARTDLAGSLPGISIQIDAALIAALGKEDGNLNKPRAVEVLKAIAWALGGTT